MKLMIGCTNKLTLERIKKSIGTLYQIHEVDDNVVNLRKMLTQIRPDLCIFDHSYQIPNLPIVFENITFNETPIIYISQSQEVGILYNLVHCPHFHLIQHNQLEKDLPTTARVIQRYTDYFGKLKLEIRDLKSKLDEEKIVSRAKIVLMEHNKMTEKDAFQLIRTESMNKRLSKKEVSQNILNQYSTKS